MRNKNFDAVVPGSNSSGGVANVKFRNERPTGIEELEVSFTARITSLNESTELELKKCVAGPGSAAVKLT